MKPTPDALGVTPLEDGEEGKPVRASKGVHAWLKTKTAKEIGDLLATLKEKLED